MFKNEDVVRVWFLELLIGFITRKANILAVSQTLNHISVVKILQDLKLVFEVFLFLAVRGRDYFKHYLFRTLPVGIDLWVAATSQKR